METNNISTIATFAAIILTVILTQFGYTVDQTQATSAIMGVITLIIAIWSSRNPNTLGILGNDKNSECTCDGSEPLNPEYESEEDGA